MAPLLFSCLFELFVRAEPNQESKFRYQGRTFQFQELWKMSLGEVLHLNMGQYATITQYKR